MPKCCMNFLTSPTLTVVTPALHIAFCERQIPSCMSLSKPIAQHFHYLSSAEKDLSMQISTDVVWLSVVLQTTSVYQEGLGLLFLFAGLLPVLGLGMCGAGTWDVQCCCSGSAVPLVR